MATKRRKKKSSVFEVVLGVALIGAGVFLVPETVGTSLYLVKLGADLASGKK